MAYTETVINGRRVVLDEDGKPCRTCNTLQDFQMLGGMGFGGATAAPGSAGTSGAALSLTGGDGSPATYRQDPPDSAQLGSSTWTFLHSMAARYPAQATPGEQAEMSSFIRTFAKYYPCAPCAADFRDYLEDNRPATGGRDDLSLWFCDAHNAVNEKLGKPTFDCRNWRARWRDGWSA